MKWLSVVLSFLVFTSPTWALAQDMGHYEILPTNINQARGSIDLIVEAQTYTPHFYNGRSEPTPGNVMKLVALPENPRAGLTFKWQVNGNPLQQQGPVANVTASTLEDRILVQVQAINSAGQTIAETSEYVDLSEPELHFYATNPLRGLSQKTLPDEAIIVGGEMEILAKPYFFGASTLTRNIIGNWSTGGRDIITEDGWPFLTVFNNSDFLGQNLNLEVRNNNNFAESASKSIRIISSL